MILTQLIMVTVMMKKRTKLRSGKRGGSRERKRGGGGMEYLYPGDGVNDKVDENKVDAAADRDDDNEDSDKC